MNDIVVSSEKQFGRALFGLNRNEVYTYLNCGMLLKNMMMLQL